MIVTTPSATFASLPAGWHSFQSFGAVATSWSYAPGRSPGGPADHMPKGGIIVSVTFPSVAGRTKPLRLLLPRRPATLLEGTTDTPEYRVEGRLHGVAVRIFVDIRNPHPTAAERRVAQRVLSSIRVRLP